MLCDTLPPLLDLDITADYMEHMGHQMQASAGLIQCIAITWLPPSLWSVQCASKRCITKVPPGTWNS